MDIRELLHHSSANSTAGKAFRLEEQTVHNYSEHKVDLSEYEKHRSVQLYARCGWVNILVKQILLLTFAGGSDSSRECRPVLQRECDFLGAS